MEAAYANLQKDGKTDVDNLVKWLKDSKVIDETEAQEEKLRSFFAEIPDRTNVTLEQFQEVMKKIEEEFKISLDEITKKLAGLGTTAEAGPEATDEAGLKITDEAGPMAATGACLSPTVSPISAAVARQASAALQQDGRPVCGTCDVPSTRCKRTT